MLFLLFGCTPNKTPPLEKTSIEGIQLTWYGVTNLLVQTEETSILLDAFYSRPALGQEGPTIEGQEKLAKRLEDNKVAELDGILIGHSHYDHATDTGVAAINHGGTVYGSQTTCLLTQAQGLPIERCIIVDNGSSFSIGSLVLKALICRIAIL